jgi:uncharacterized protein (TIRG00374 family)
MPPLPERPTGDDADPSRRWRYRAVLWSVLAAALGYLAFALWGGWRDVASSVARIGAGGIAVVLSLSLANYGLRFVRWQAYLRAMDHPMPWGPSLRIYLAGFALTTTPGKAGEALRGVLLKRRGVPYPTSLAAFLSERLSDLVAVLMLTLFGLTVYPPARAMVAVGGAAVLAALVVLANQRLLERAHRAARGRARVPTLLRHLIDIAWQPRRCHAPARLAGATLLSLAAWAAEAWAFNLILAWMGLEIGPAFAVFVYSIAMLAGALSFLPGGLGGAEAVMVSLLVWKGAGSAEAVAATVVIRLATLWFAVALGACALVSSSDDQEIRTPGST